MEPEIVQNEPVSLAQALSGVLMTGVALVAIYVPGLDEGAQFAIIAFGNSVIVLGSVIWARRRVYPTSRVRALVQKAAETGKTPRNL